MRLCGARGRGVAAAATLATILGGCGSSDRDQVHAKVDQFVHAIAARNYKALCTEVLAPSLLSHVTSYGIKCEQAMQVAFNQVNHPGLAVGAITLHGTHASVDTITTAKGQEASLDAIELTKMSSGWRIVALGTPQVPGGHGRGGKTTPTGLTVGGKNAPNSQTKPAKPAG